MRIDNPPSEMHPETSPALTGDATPMHAAMLEATPMRPAGFATPLDMGLAGGATPRVGTHAADDQDEYVATVSGHTDAMPSGGINLPTESAGSNPPSAS